MSKGMSGGHTKKHWSLRPKSADKLRTARLVVWSLFVWSLFIPLLSVLLDFQAYNLTAEAKTVIGSANSNLSAKFSYNDEGKKWVFNREGLGVRAEQLAQAQGTGTNQAAGALNQMRAQIGGGGKDDDSLYSAALPVNASEGTRYYDNETGESFTMTPTFALGDGKLWQGRVIYPIRGGGQLVYTAKTNGMKEDIVLGKSLGDSLTYSYKFDLPKTLEAKLLNDGSVGVYSASPALFTATASTDEDKARLENARETAAKDHLVFAVPAPVVQDAKGKKVMGTFTLREGILTLHSHGLEDLAYPISIDPSVVITSSSDFTAGDNAGGIDFSTSGLISGSKLTGGTIGAWNSTASISHGTGGQYNAGIATYNGYIYMVGAGAGAEADDVAYAALNSNGTIGAWTVQANTLPSGGAGYTGTFAYNGYMYMIGGTDSSFNPISTARYAPINSNGSLGTWQTTTSLPLMRTGATAAVYNGYAYIVGGYDGSGPTNTTYYAKLNADGTIGAWNTTSTLNTARTTGNGFVYNGYLYTIGGYNAVSTNYASVEYARIKDDGTLSSWMTTTSFTTARASMGVTVADGYVYMAGGSTGSPNYTAGLSDIQYAQINANGTLGTWRTSTALPNGATGPLAASYNGYVYFGLGRNDGAGSYSSVYYAQVNNAGTTNAWTTSGNTFSTARALSCSIAYNGYLYILGGSTDDTVNNNVTTVQYAALSADGSVGTWNSTTALPEARGYFGCAAYNGRLYIAGGYTGSPTGTLATSSRYISVNANGTLAASWTNGTATSANISLGTGFIHTTSDGTTRFYLGGTLNSSYSAIVYSTINASTGALGTFTNMTNDPADIVANLRFGRYALVGNYVYYYASLNNANYSNQVLYTTIASDGTFNAWQTTANLPGALSWSSSTTVNGCIYAVGGWDTTGSVSVDSVYYACPNANGTISNWYSAPGIPVGTEDMGLASYNGFIYGVGGYTNTVVNTVKYAKVNNGGGGGVIGGVWQLDSTGVLNTARVRNATVAYNGYLYSILGQSGYGGSDIGDIEYAPINADGTIGTWTVEPRSAASAAVLGLRRDPGAAAYNGYLYVLGGMTGSGVTYRKDIIYAPISSNGTLSANWASAGANVSNGGKGVNLVFYNGYAYSIGGYDGTVDHNSVRYAVVNANGTLGTWNSTTSFTTARSDSTSVAYNGYMYLIGGEGSSTYNTVQFAAINPANGTLGTWNHTTSFTGLRSDAAVGAYNGFLYIASGQSSGSTPAYGDVQMTPIYSDGRLGAWQQAALGGNNDPIGGFTASSQLIHEGRLYITGGSEKAGFLLSGTAYVSLDSIPRKAQYSKLITLSEFGSNITLTYNGSSNPGGTTLEYATAGTDGVLGARTTGTSGAGIDPGLVCSTPTMKYAWVKAVIDDSSRASFMGGTASNITDITAYYGLSTRAQPNLRLHGGKFFYNQSLRPLDTCVL